MKINISAECFNEAFSDFLFDYDSARYEVYYGGAGSGKSHFVCQKIILKCLKSKRRVLCVRKVQNTIRQSTFQLMGQIIREWKLSNYIKVNHSEMKFTFIPTGSEIIFRGIDDPEKIKSIASIDDIWIEEASELVLDDFTQLDLRLRSEAPGQQIYLSYNPVSKTNWVYNRFHNPETRQLDNTRVMHTTYKDNKFLPKSYVDSIKALQKTNYNYYLIYALGEFCTLDKLIYTNWETRDFDINSIKGTNLCGLDFGYANDPTAIVFSVLDEANKTIYIAKEYVATNKTNDEIARILKSLSLSKTKIICDSAEPKSIEELRRNGILNVQASVKGKDSVLHGIQRLQQYKIIVSPNCEQTITELSNYTWMKDKKTNEYVNQPIDCFNHCLDALRYSLQCAENKVTIVNKSLFF